MAEYHSKMADWVETEPALECLLPNPVGEGQCKWEYHTSGLDTKGDVQDAFSRHLKRHDEQLGSQLDAWAQGR